jgi:UDP:flavonoid glycosyltransferase YjiC (YdhE family)
VAGGGFSLMSEAVYLGKPLLAIPLRGQFEQVMNARYLHRTGYGMCVERTSKSALGLFLERIGEFEGTLARYEQVGNSVALRAVEQTAEAAAEEGPRERRRAKRQAHRAVLR